MPGFLKSFGPQISRSGLATFSLLLGLMLIISCLGACGGQKASLLETIQHRKKLVAGVKFDSKPFGFLDPNGQLQGYDIDLMRELARRILNDPQAVEFQQVFSSTRVIALNSGTVDLVAATMTITPEREKFVDFSQPYFTAHQAVAVPASSPVKSLNDLNGKTILFVMGTTSEKTIKERLPQAKYLGFKSSTDAFSALKAGRGNAMTTDDSILSGFLSENCGYRLLDERLSNEPYGLGIAQERNASTMEFRKRIDQELAVMAKDGTLDKLKAKWVDAALKTRHCPN